MHIKEKRENMDESMKKIEEFQLNEITEYHIYKNIAKMVKNKEDKKILQKIADEELKHYNLWKSHTNKDIKPSKLKIFMYSNLARVFGYTFVLKLMENKLNGVIKEYTENADMINEIPEIKEIYDDEVLHEQEMLELIDEKRLQYVSSMVLGMNDAIVEFTGARAGYSFALSDNRLITLIGLITGISATLSMASSEYLSTKHEGVKNPFEAAAYTGFAYFITVIALISPYALLPKHAILPALGIMLLVVIFIIGVFNYYVTVAKGGVFKKQFFEMAAISLGVASISFIIGIVLKKIIGIEF